MLTKNIIVNASDFGLSNAINYGIIDCFKHGIVTSTDLLCTTPGFDHAVDLALKNPNLDIGVHFSLTVGTPVIKEYNEILAPTGSMKQDYDYLSNVPLNVIRNELNAQLNKIIATGIKPSHITFHHTPSIIPDILNVALELATKNNLTLRAYAKREVQCNLFNRKYIYTNSFDIDFYRDKITSIEDFKNIFSKFKDKNNIEINCQPGYIDTYSLENSSYSSKKIKEIDILCSSEIKNLISSNGFKLLNYREF